MGDACPNCGWPPCHHMHPGTGSRCIRPKEHMGRHRSVLGAVWNDHAAGWASSFSTGQES